MRLHLTHLCCSIHLPEQRSLRAVTFEKLPFVCHPTRPARRPNADGGVPIRQRTRARLPTLDKDGHLFHLPIRLIATAISALTSYPQAAFIRYSGHLSVRGQRKQTTAVTSTFNA